jgi:transposase-like protein
MSEEKKGRPQYPAEVRSRRSGWGRRAETDAGDRPGRHSDERARLKELERENRELRWANEILKVTVVFFGVELDRQEAR